MICHTKSWGLIARIRAAFRVPILLNTRLAQSRVVKRVRAWEIFLKVTDWSSGFESANRYLGHFKRKIRSEGTKELCCDVLMRFCKFTGKNPDKLVRLSPREASKLVQGYVDSLADKGQSIRTVNVGLTFLRTFFRVNGFKGEKEIEVERFFQPSRYRKRSEYIPTADEIFRMAYAAGSAKNQAMIFCLYTSGLRNSTLRALRYGDVAAELDTCEVIKAPVYPEMKHVDPRACKGNVPYYSFFSKETVVALKEYLNERRSLNGSIEDDEPLFASTSSNMPQEVRRCTPVKRNTLDLVVKRAAKKGGVERWREVHPHCLRKAFDSALRNDGLDVKDQEFLMGHILPGTQDTYYDKTKVEVLRQKYAKVNFFPERGHLADSEEKLAQAFRKQLLLVAGFKEEEIAKMDLHELSDAQLQETVRNKLLGANNGNHSRQKVVSVEEADRYLAQGWQYVARLSDNKIVIKQA